MKKLLALVLAVVMIASLSVCAFADSSDSYAFYYSPEEEKVQLYSTPAERDTAAFIAFYHDYLERYVFIYFELIDDGNDMYLPYCQGALERYKRGEQIVGFLVNGEFYTEENLPALKGGDVICLCWTNDAPPSSADEEAAVVKDTIDGSAVTFTAPAKENAETGSTLAPVIALSALVVLAGAVVVSKKSK